MPVLVLQHTATISEKPTTDRDPLVRSKDFHQTREPHDILAKFRGAKACCACSNKFCNRGDVPVEETANGCPLNTRIPDWLAKVASAPVLAALEKIMEQSEQGTLTQQGLDNTIDLLLKDRAARNNVMEGVALAYDRNPMPEILGDICPQAEGLCEGGSQRAGNSCVAGAAGFGAITIGNIENLLGYIGRRSGWLEETLKKPVIHKEHIAIVGAGPAGMSVAMEFRRAGYSVTLVDEGDGIGGLLRYGLPGTKIEKDVIADYGRIFVASGIKVETKTHVDDVKMAEIRSKHTDTILAVGAQNPNKLGIEGDDVKGIVDWNSFLSQSIKMNNLRPLYPEERVAIGKRAAELSAAFKDVAVIGAGDTAMDAAREVKRQQNAAGGGTVMLIIRGTEEDIRAVAKEVRRLREEGIKVISSRQAVSIKSENGAVTEVTFDVLDPRVRVNGRPAVVGRESHKLSMLINALGSTVEDNLAAKLGIPGLQQGKNGGIKIVDPNFDFRAELAAEDGQGARLVGTKPVRPADDLYAIGDMVQVRGESGPVLAVHAVLHGKKVFEQINAKYAIPAL